MVKFNRLRRPRATALVPPVGVALNFGALTRQGFGGFPTSETAASTLTGTHASSFAIDARGHLIPKITGSYGSTWTAPIASGVTTLTGASGTVYTVTIVPRRADIRESYGYNDASGNDESYHQLGLTFPEIDPVNDNYEIVGRDGHFNPDMKLYNVPRRSSYTAGTGRITIRSETIDATVDADGWPTENHGFKIGRFRFTGSGALPVDLRYLAFYCNKSDAGTQNLLDIKLGCYGWTSLYCSYKAGPAVVSPWVLTAVGWNIGGEVSRCRMQNLGTCLSVSDNTVQTNITYNHFTEIFGDNINCAGQTLKNVLIHRNFSHNWKYAGAVAQAHADGIQFQCPGRDPLNAGSGYTNGVHPGISLVGGTTTGVVATITVTGGSVSFVEITSGNSAANMTPGDVLTASGGIGPGSNFTWKVGDTDNIVVTENFFGRNLGTVNGSDGQGLFGNENIFKGLTVKRNIVLLSGPTSFDLGGFLNPDVRYNLFLTDLTSDHTSVVNSILETRTWLESKGGYVSDNMANAYDLGGIVDTVITENATVARNTTAYQAIFPTFPTTQRSNAFNNWASILAIFTPVAATGTNTAGRSDSRYRTPFFPNGAWNDGTVYAPGDGAWVAAHPPATF